MKVSIDPDFKADVCNVFDVIILSLNEQRQPQVSHIRAEKCYYIIFMLFCLFKSPNMSTSSSAYGVSLRWDYKEMLGSDNYFCKSFCHF